MVALPKSPLWLVAVAWAATLEAQQPAPSYVPYQAPQRPDYLVDISVGQAPWRLPHPSHR
jgi:hypothetical protein